MLKVVGASWFQTRISTYILVAVGLLGIGAFLLGEFGSVEKDGTYSATVFWNHKGGYRIDFWGQGNDLISLPRGAARAYYKTRIQETGWSIVEIETSPSYPDAVQAYAAGLLEGSLTWQLIHHHWYNTIGTLCSLDKNKETCSMVREKLRENAADVREKANSLASEDPFWHMVRMFYAQLDGLEAGWRFAVRRSRRSVEIESEDFLWLAIASDIPETLFQNKSTAASAKNPKDIPEFLSERNHHNGVIFVKSLDRSIDGLDPIIVIAQNTVAPYVKMLRLLKRYKFGYHLSGTRHSPRAPTNAVFMSSYPGALSSHDEYYVVSGGKDNDDILILAAIPLRDSSAIISSSSTSGPEDDRENERTEEEEESVFNIQGVMPAVRIMSANRLATEARPWSRHLARGNPLEETKRTWRNLQWVTLKPKDSAVWLIEQYSSTIRAVDRSLVFGNNGFVFCDGEEVSKKLVPSENLNNEDLNIDDPRIDHFFTENITSVESIRNLMRGTGKYLDEDNMEDRGNVSSTEVESLETNESRLPFSLKPLKKFVFRGDLESPSRPEGIIDNKITVVTASGIEIFEATSGPPYGHEMAGSLTQPFDWSKSFKNISRIGQPDTFRFNSVIPEWVWF